MDPALPRPRYGELIAVTCLGAIHMLIELTLSLEGARIYNAAVLFVGAAYLIWRAATTKNLLHQWGMRTNNFWAAIRRHSLFLASATVGLVAWAAGRGHLAFPSTMWLVLLLYPFFGVAQQFILQNLIASNLSGLFQNRILCAVVAASLFSLSHLPRTTLAAMAFVGGFFLTLIYRRVPNLWAVGIVHGYLAALVFYLVLKKDPGARILETLHDYIGIGIDGLR